MNQESEELNSAEEISAKIEKQVIDFVSNPHYRPLKPRVIANRLDYDADQRYVMRRVIKRLVKQGRLKWGARHLVMLPKDGPPVSGSPASSAMRSGNPSRTETSRINEPDSRSARTRKAGSVEREFVNDPADSGGRSGKKSGTRPDEVVGVYRRASAGYGFVTPSGSTSGDRSDDVFIPQGNSLDAVDRDTVRVKLRRGRQGPRLKLSGTVVEVVERKRYRFVGTLITRGKKGFAEIDGGEFDKLVSVGDASAKNGRDGDKVVIEMIHFPSSEYPGEAVIVEILGKRGEPGVDTKTIIHQFDLPGPFSAEVMEDTHRQTEKFEPVIGGSRVDLTAETIVTIDPATARDFDDAISLTRTEEGNWRLGVHIADVSHFVPAGSALDNEAYVRGNSVYLPDKVIPMLPEAISNGLASLQPDQLRYTMSVFMTVDQEGGVLDVEWCRGAIRSRHRFTYEEVDEYLADDKPWKERLDPAVFDLVRNMHSLAMTMRRRRMERGAIELTLPDVQVDLDEEGAVCGAHIEVNTESHQLIEEFMLAANQAVARKLADLGHLVLRRIHERPSERRLRELTEFVQSLGIECEDLQDRFEIRQIIEAAKDRPEKYAINMAVLRSMQKAIYSPKIEGHYALASKAYCHFTSPIRRYPDLVTHRMVGDIIDGKRPRADQEYLAKTGEHCSETEQRAEQAERELNKLKMINYLARRLGMEMEAIITGVESWGIFVLGVELPAEGLLPVENLPYDQYTFDPASRTMSGCKQANQFRLGDHLRIVVERADPNRRELTFGLAGEKRPRSSSRRGTAAGNNGNTVRRKRAGESDPDRGRSGGAKAKQSGKPKRKPRRRG